MTSPEILIYQTLFFISKAFEVMSAGNYRISKISSSISSIAVESYFSLSNFSRLFDLVLAVKYFENFLQVPPTVSLNKIKTFWRTNLIFFVIKPEPETKRPFWKSYNFSFTHSFEFWFLANGSLNNRKKKKSHIIWWNCVKRTKINKRWKKLKKNLIFFDEFRPHVQAKGKIIRNELKQSHESYFQLLIQHLQF